MYAQKRIIAVITARGGSKGLPRKNIRPLLGKPLIGWTIEQAAICPEIDAIVVSTEDDEIADTARQFGAEVPFLRPPELASDTASSIDVVMHVVDELAQRGRSFDVLVLLEPTSPLREPSDITGALHKMIGTPGAESIVGVAAAEAFHPSYLFSFEDELLRRYSDAQPAVLRRQQLEPLYYPEGSVYISTIDALRSKRGFYHDRTLGWIVPKYKATNIDELCDFICAEALMAARLDGSLSNV